MELSVKTNLFSPTVKSSAIVTFAFGAGWLKVATDVKFVDPWHLIPLSHCKVCASMVVQFNAGNEFKEEQPDPEHVKFNENVPSPQSIYVAFAEEVIGTSCGLSEGHALLL